MITKVEVRKSTTGEVLVLPLLNSDNGFRVIDIEGLDPVPTTLVSSSIANSDGEYYQSSRRVPRNIKFTLALQVGHPDYSVDEIRHSLYKWFAQKIPLTFRFFTTTLDIQTVEIIGRVETVESSPFSKDPVMVISTVCHKPLFVDIRDTQIGAFTYTDTPTTATFFYDGTAETGFMFVMLAEYPLNDMIITHKGPDNVEKQITLNNMDLQVDDILMLGTESGKKEIVRLRPSEGFLEVSILYTMAAGSQWIELQPGANLFSVQTMSGVNVFTLEYFNKYGGL